MLAERYGVAARQLHPRRAVRTAKLTSPVRCASQARAARTSGRQPGGGAAAAGAASAKNASAVAAMRPTPAQASLSDVSDAEFLHTLTPAESDALEEMGEPGSSSTGAVIFEQGGAADCVFLVRGGRVRITARGAGGDEIVLADRGPGELLGDLAGIDGQPRSASVTALDDVRGLIVPLRAFRAFLMDHPRAAISMLELISRRLREAEARQISR